MTWDSKIWDPGGPGARCCPQLTARGPEGPSPGTSVDANLSPEHQSPFRTHNPSLMWPQEAPSPPPPTGLLGLFPRLCINTGSAQPERSPRTICHYPLCPLLSGTPAQAIPFIPTTARTGKPLPSVRGTQGKPLGQGDRGSRNEVPETGVCG